MTEIIALKNNNNECLNAKNTIQIQFRKMINILLNKCAHFDLLWKGHFN